MQDALSILNDLHCGVVRSGGTTPKTSFELRLWVLDQFEALLGIIDNDLLILGDLLDAYSIPYMDLLRVFDALISWLNDHPECKLFLVPGNHDLSKTVATMSSFQFLAKLLELHPNVRVLATPGMVEGHDAYVIPHVINQDQFDIELTKVPAVTNLLVHCNYDNKFAQQSDHSLNLSMDQALKLPVKRIVFAHEHQGRTTMNGKVVVIGNQIPTSVADCLGNRCKHMLRLSSDGGLESVEVWDEDGSFLQIDWREALSADPGAQFIRVTGDASTGEANLVVNAISKLRSVHNAFVITNGVKIEGRSSEGEKISLEQIKSYNVLEALLRRLSPAQAAVVKQLLEDNNVGE